MTYRQLNNKSTLYQHIEDLRNFLAERDMTLTAIDDHIFIANNDSEVRLINEEGERVTELPGFDPMIYRVRVFKGIRYDG